MTSNGDAPTSLGRRQLRADDPSAVRARNKPVGQVLRRAVGKTVLGVNPKKYSQFKPRLHNRSLAPRDIYKFWESSQVDNSELSAHKDHVNSEFFDHPSATSPRSRQFAPVPRRAPLSSLYNDIVKKQEAQRQQDQKQEQQIKKCCVLPCGGKPTRVDPENKPTIVGKSGQNALGTGQWIIKTRMKPTPDSETGADLKERTDVERSNRRDGDHVDSVNEQKGVSEDKPNDLEKFIEDVWDNSDRASVGMKLLRKVFGFSYVQLDNPK